MMNTIIYCIYGRGDTVEILPISAMRDTNMISEIVTQQKEPVFITKNGAGHMVILEHNEFMRMKEEMRLYKSAVDASRQYKEDGEELSDFDDFMGEIEKEYGIQSKADKRRKK